MIRITQVKLPLDHTEADLKIRVAKLLRIPDERVKKVRIVKRSVDARRRGETAFSYVLDVETDREEQVVARSKNPNASIYEEKPYHFPAPGLPGTDPLGVAFGREGPPRVASGREDPSGAERGTLSHPPVVIGSGPAGLFCALMLARHGYCPLVLERGGPVGERTKKVQAFWEMGKLDPNCNVQFGEGGAGTFSDGKLNTLVKDPAGRNRKVLELFVQFGADQEICYVNKPHIGTDVLCKIVEAMREEIIRLGGQVRFYSQVTDFQVEAARPTDSKAGQGRITGVIVNGTELVPAEAVILAIGHSARDTFSVLKERQVPMEAKAFAVGLRILHPQAMVDEAQYKGDRQAARLLGPASYKLTHRCSDGRGVYSFCMCPGGFVVNASSEEGRLAVNGMSYHARDGEDANSALIVTVTPEDFGEEGGEAGPLAGIAFQRRLEERAFQTGGGKIPVQLYGDFKEGRVLAGFGQVRPQFKGETAFADLRKILPAPVVAGLLEGIGRFGQIIRGFDRPDAILAGVESRTSSPVRILRDEHLESQIKGLFPCGEGAGYAGGITSAAMDGLKVAEEIARRYRPFLKG